MKSALELAMEKADRMGGGKTKKLTAQQKKEIAEIRSKAEARIAEIKIMMDEKVNRLSAAGAEGEAAIGELKREFASEKSKIDEEAERSIEKLKGRD